MKRSIQFPYPIFITKESKWFVADCPILNIATQGKTEKELKENMKELIETYLNDPDTLKPSFKNVGSSSLTYIAASTPEELIYG